MGGRDLDPMVSSLGQGREWTRYRNPFNESESTDKALDIIVITEP